jgi:hypothetical protein
MKTSTKPRLASGLTGVFHAPTKIFVAIVFAEKGPYSLAILHLLRASPNRRQKKYEILP